MANEFQELIELIRNVVVFILEWTLNLICLVLLVVSLALPWRLIAFFGRSKKMKDMAEFRMLGAASFFISAIDLIVLPFLFLGILSVTRAANVINAIMPCKTDEIHNDQDGIEAIGVKFWRRAAIVSNGFMGVFDLICLVLGAFALCVPTTTASVCGGACKLTSAWAKGQFSSRRSTACFSADNTYNFLFALDILLVKFFLVAAGDLLVLPWLALSALVPTRTGIVYRRLGELNRNDALDTYEPSNAEPAFVVTRFINRGKLYCLAFETVRGRAAPVLNRLANMVIFSLLFVC